MKDILVVTGMYLPRPSANGACLDSLLKELNNKGLYSHIVSLTPNTESYETTYSCVYPVKVAFNTKFSFIRKIESGWKQLLNYPLHSKQIISRALQVCEEIIDRYQPEFVICVQKPADSGYIGLKLKRNHPALNIILYELDSLTDNISNYKTWTRFFKKRNKKLEDLIFEGVDTIFHIQCHRDYYEGEGYDSQRKKSLVVDIPLVNKATYLQSIAKKRDNAVRFIYSGVLTKATRTPVYLLSVLKAIHDRGDNTIEMDFYSHGEFEQYIQEFARRERMHIRANGFVLKDQLDREVANSDILVSIGNIPVGQVFSIPSKIFYYISMGKPIVHIAPDESDVCIPYLNKYPMAVILYETDDVFVNADRLIKFIDSIDGSLVSWEYIEETYRENTAVYTVEKMIDSISKS